jgi:hypothetical protein
MGSGVGLPGGVNAYLSSPTDWNTEAKVGMAMASGFVSSTVMRSCGFASSQVLTWVK